MTLKDLEFHVKKTEKKFLENYAISDEAARLGDDLLRSNELESQAFGEDRRFERVWEAGKDKPDRIIKFKGREVALLDWKGKKKDDWMLNERAYNSYIEWGRKKSLPVYVAIWSQESDAGKFIRLPSKTMTRRQMWDLNWVVVFDLREMKPWDTLPDELKSL